MALVDVEVLNGLFRTRVTIDHVTSQKLSSYYKYSYTLHITGLTMWQKFAMMNHYYLSEEEIGTHVFCN